MNSDFLWALAGTQFLFCMTSLGAALVFLCADRTGAAGQELLLGFSGGVTGSCVAISESGSIRSYSHRKESSLANTASVSTFPSRKI